nr:superoxide dismutase [Nephromyces sp. MMRI]
MQRLFSNSLKAGMASRSRAVPNLADFYKKLDLTELLEGKPFSLVPLLYQPYELSPHISETIVTYHYGKHHATYVRNLNDFAAKDPSLAKKSLEEVVKTSEGAVFNNAAQIWNHNLYWACMGPNTSGKPSGSLASAIDKSFNSFDEFKIEFSSKAAGVFGSGWAFLVKQPNGKLIIETTSNAVNPLKTGSGTALLGLDVWEHAYYLDYFNRRPAYIKGFFELVDWDYVSQRFEGSAE